jgi:hypothetical protein
LGEVMTLPALLGGGLIIVGIWLVNRQTIWHRMVSTADDNPWASKWIPPFFWSAAFLFCLSQWRQFFLGVWLLLPQIHGKSRLWQVAALALLVGIVFFEAALIGLSFDMRSYQVGRGAGWILLNAAGIGLAAFAFVSFFLPVSAFVLRIVKSE